MVSAWEAKLSDNNVAVDRTMAEGQQVRRQRSRSLAGPLSRSADWTEELERRLRSGGEDGGGSCGSGEYLVGYRGGGSQPLCATRRSSCGQVSTCGFQDIFTGEYCSLGPWMQRISKMLLNLNLMLRQTLKFLHVQNTEMGLKKDQYMEDMTSLSTLKAFSQCPKHRCWAVAHCRHHVIQFVINNASRHFKLQTSSTFIHWSHMFPYSSLGEILQFLIQQVNLIIRVWQVSAHHAVVKVLLTSATF